jgi:hypothetical protein
MRVSEHLRLALCTLGIHSYVNSGMVSSIIAGAALLSYECKHCRKQRVEWFPVKRM